MLIEVDWRGLYVTCDVDGPTGPHRFNGSGPDIGSVSVRSAVIADVDEYTSWEEDMICAREGQEIDPSTVEDDEDFRRVAWEAWEVME